VSWRWAHCLIQRGGPTEALRLCRDAAAGLPEEEALLRAVLAAGESGALLALTRYDEAVDAARQALQATERAERSYLPPRDRVRLALARARAHGTLGVVSRLRQDEQGAVAHFERAAADAAAAGEERLRHAALFNLGAVRFVAGDLDGASAALEELLPQMEARGDSHGQGRVLHALAAIHLARDDPSSALDLLDRACAIKERMGDVNGTANSQNSRAMALLRLGRLPEARAAVERALAVPAADAEAWARCYFLTTRAAIDLVSGAVDVALDGYRDALRQPGIAGTDAQARASVQLVLALLVAGDADAAERLLQKPVGQQELAVRLERRFAAGVLGLARDAPAEARAAAREIEHDALPAYPAYRTAATALLTAADAPGPVDLAAVVATLFTAPAVTP
jgi:tetratricopeptide (TPR) repeat protein